MYRRPLMPKRKAVLAGHTRPDPQQPRHRPFFCRSDVTTLKIVGGRLARERWERPLS